jgi:hypothetical protein
MKKQTPSYRKAIEWIAINDDPGSPESMDIECVRHYISVCLIADLFAKDQIIVACAVVRLREKILKT